MGWGQEGSVSPPILQSCHLHRVRNGPRGDDGNWWVGSPHVSPPYSGSWCPCPGWWQGDTPKAYDTPKCEFGDGKQQVAGGAGDIQG